MSDTVIQVENLWKEYRLGVISHHTLSRDLQSWWARVRGQDDPNSQIGSTPIKDIQASIHLSHATDDDHFWALQGISIEVKKGDLVGVIGRNGAGKSTLLKILSQVTSPTRGEIRYKGRIASLLEVGTGFHPELTGRENIFLNGAILGMNKAEIQRKFDEIVAFAEVERFLDTPVKRYSSGMYVRLAFAVAAHLEPEILIVDEVLAVGDAQFQKKCLGKMEDVGREGRTVLFVSHNMTAIQHLCTSCVLLGAGQIKSIGSPSHVIAEYLSDSLVLGNMELGDRKDRKGSGDVRFQSVRFTNELGKEVAAFRCGDAACFNIEIVNQKGTRQKNVVVAFGIDNNRGERIAIISNDVCGQSLEITRETKLISILVSNLPLTPGRYYYTLFITANGIISDWIQKAGFFTIEEYDYYGTGKMLQDDGFLLLDYKFELSSQPFFR